jgi:hypothetical protein
MDDLFSGGIFGTVSAYMPEGEILRPLVLGLLAIAVIALTPALVRLWLRRLAEAAQAELEARCPGEKVVLRDGANFFGLDSAALGQVRGNGLLVLTDRKLLFRRAVPGRWIEIPLEKVRGVGNPRRFLGKGCLSRLLVVRFTNEEGGENSVGWAVRDAEKWADRIAVF